MCEFVFAVGEDGVKVRRTTIYFLFVLLGGPVTALLSLMAGCAMPWQLFGVMCGHNTYISLTFLTLGTWAIFVFVAVFFHLREMLR